MLKVLGSMPETLFYYQFSVSVKTTVKDLPPNKSYLHSCVSLVISLCLHLVNFTAFITDLVQQRGVFCLELSSCLANQMVKPEVDTEVLRLRESWNQKGCYLP